MDRPLKDSRIRISIRMHNPRGNAARPGCTRALVKSNGASKQLESGKLTGISFRFGGISVKGTRDPRARSGAGRLRSLTRIYPRLQACLAIKKAGATLPFLPEHESLRFGVGFPD